MNCELKKENGMMCISIDGRTMVPLSFKSFRPCARNISDFYKAGIRLFNILTSGITSAVGVPYTLYGESWLDDETYDFTSVDRQIDLFVENAPDAYFSLMIQLDTREWWLKKYPGYPDSFRKMSQMEADTYWREMAAKYMQAVIKHVEEKYKDRFYGYFLLGGTTTEWFSDESNEEPTELVENAFRTWKDREDISVPEENVRETPWDVVFLDSQEEDTLIDYRKFGGWQRADTVLYFAKKAQEVLQHKRLLGVYFGYILELGSARLWNTGHLDYERVFLSEDIDMISSPIAYGYRAQDCGSHQMLTSSTLTLNEKLYFIEHDQTSCLVPDIIEGKRFVHPNKVKTVEEDINLLRRDYMLAASNGCAMWWFDMFGGWFYNERIMNEITNMVTVSKMLFEAGSRSISEIAFIIDPESMYYVNKNSALNNMLFYFQRGELAYLGAPYDIYSSCDAEKIDIAQYKLFVFLDQFKQDDKMDTWILKLKKHGKTLLFVYAYNIIDKKYDLSSMSRALGMKVVENPQLEDKIILKEEKKTPCSSLAAEADIKRKCFSVADDVTVLGCYQNSKEPAFVYKREGASIVAFSGLGILKAGAFQIMMEVAGVHQYTSSRDTIVYVNDTLLGIYHSNTTDALLHLPKDESYVDAFNGYKEYVSYHQVLHIPYENNRAKLLLKKSVLKGEDL